MAWFKQKTPQVPFCGPSFKERTTRFWEWFAAEADRMQAVIDDARCGELSEEMIQRVKEAFPRGIGWVFGPAVTKEGHSFTVSPEGNRENQFLAEYWLGQAPDLPHWEFYGAKRGDPTAVGGAFQVGPHTFQFEGLWLTLRENVEREKLDLVAWHPLFEKLPESQRMTILFLILDEVLGEYGTENWIGSIDASDTQLKEAIPLAELPATIERTAETTGWRKFPPPDTFTVYSYKELQGDFLRGDVISGSSSHVNLLDEWTRSYGPVKDPLAGSGADFVFCAVTSALLPKGKEVDTRSRMEEAVTARLEAAGAGKCFGGATGTDHFYSDFILYDGQASLDLLRESLAEFELPPGTGIHFFAKEKSRFDVIIV